MTMSSKMLSRVFVSLSLTTLFVSGCVAVDAEVPDVTVIQRDLSVEALPIEGLPAEALAELKKERSVSVPPFSYAHGPIDFPTGFSSNLRTVGVQLVANRGIEDFSFVRKMKIVLSDGKNEPLDLASFDRDNGDTTETNTLTFKTVSPSDTLKMWQTDSVTFNLDLTGTVPTEAWSMDVVVRFSGDFAYSL